MLVEIFMILDIFRIVTCVAIFMSIGVCHFAASSPFGAVAREVTRETRDRKGKCQLWYKMHRCFCLFVCLFFVYVAIPVAAVVFIAGV